MEGGGREGVLGSVTARRKMAAASAGTTVDISVSFAPWRRGEQTVAAVALVTQRPLGSACHSKRFCCCCCLFSAALKS